MKQSFISDVKLIESHIEQLSLLIDESKPPYTRRPFTKAYEKSRNWLKEKMIESGLEVHVDAASNLIGVRKGTNPYLPPIMIGSHTDSVIGGGRFDGIIGVLAGIEIARQLSEKGIYLQHTLFIVDFTAEEASEFGISTIGSRGMIGNLSEEILERKNADGIKLREGIASCGGRPEIMREERKKPGDLHLYLELHIEQGPILDQHNYELGIVTGIVGIRRVKVIIEGEVNHAGTTPMTMRKDALTAASEVILSIEEIASLPFEEQLVGTVGRLFVKPNGSNVVPGKVTFDFELRSLSEDVLNKATKKIEVEMDKIATKRNILIKRRALSKSESIKIEDEIIEGIEKSCKLVGKSMKLPSGAGHDANHMAKISSVGMIFVPSNKGISHSSDEWTDYELVMKGINAMWNSLIYFDNYMSNKK